MCLPVDIRVPKTKFSMPLYSGHLTEPADGHTVTFKVLTFGKVKSFVLMKTRILNN